MRGERNQRSSSSSVPEDILKDFELLSWAQKTIRSIPHLPSGELRDDLQARLSSLLTRQPYFDRISELKGEIKDLKIQVKQLESGNDRNTVLLPQESHVVNSRGRGGTTLIVFTIIVLLFVLTWFRYS